MSNKIILQKFDIKGWQTIVKELQKIKGGSFKDILRKEVTEVLAQTANRKSTKIADHVSIVNYFMPYGTYFKGIMGKKKGYTLKSGEAGIGRQKTYLLTRRLPNHIWNYILDKQNKRVKSPYNNVGLNKGQFAYMAKALNMPLSKFNTSAKNFLNKSQTTISGNVFAEEKGKTEKEYKIIVKSNLTKAIRFGKGATNFRSVMKGRVRKIERALAKGILKDIKKRTRAYPLIFG